MAGIFGIAMLVAALIESTGLSISNYERTMPQLVASLSCLVSLCLTFLEIKPSRRPFLRAFVLAVIWGLTLSNLITRILPTVSSTVWRFKHHRSVNGQGRRTSEIIKKFQGIVKILRGVTSLVFAFVCLILAWVMLRLITRVRSSILQAAGDSDQENEWTFGQIVALSTWVPVIIEFVYILLRKLLSPSFIL